MSLLANVCDVSTACVQMVSDLEHDGPPPVGRTAFIAVAIGAILLAFIAYEEIISRRKK